MAKPQPAPPPPRNGSPPPARTEPKGKDTFAVTSGKIDKPQRVLLYGPGGIGKSTLASLAPDPVFIDLEDGTKALDVQRVEGIETWADLRACLQSDMLDGFKTVVIDSATRAEELAVEHTLATIKTDKGHIPKSIEDYNWGKGPTHVYDTFMLLIQDLDLQRRRGRNVILVAHECINDAPNPYGEDYIRYEPSLQAPKQGKKDTGNIRNRVYQWADHVLFIGYDVVADEDGKGKGGGTRTIYTSELPTHRAKSRLASESLQFQAATDDAIWQVIFGGAQ